LAEKVVDASVVAALVFGEERGEEAAALLDGHRLLAPNLLPYEMASVYRKKVLTVPAKRENLRDGLLDGLRLGIELTPVSAAAVADLALEKRVTVYDAAYLWLAATLEIELLTFDADLAAIR
jgi:predicted nucleic acid-binding protein